MRESIGAAGQGQAHELQRDFASPGEEPAWPARAGSNTCEHEGTTFSHLMYGLVATLFVLPMLIPGIPMVWLTAAYGSLFIALAAGIVMWSLVSRLRGRRSRR